MKDKVEQLLPLIASGECSKTEAEQLLQEIRQAIKDAPAKGKELGILISQLSQAIKNQPPDLAINLLPIAGGHIAIGHKPGGKLPCDGLKKLGITAILTLLHDNEGARQIGDQVKKAGIEWVWFPFSASKPHDSQNISMVFELFTHLKNSLANGGKIYIHCSAGIHRTGMMAYALMRYLGQDELQARRNLQNLREVTASQVGDERLQWGDQFGN